MLSFKSLHAHRPDAAVPFTTPSPARRGTRLENEGRTWRALLVGLGLRMVIRCDDDDVDGFGTGRSSAASSVDVAAADSDGRGIEEEYDHDDADCRHHSSLAFTRTCRVAIMQLVWQSCS